MQTSPAPSAPDANWKAEAYLSRHIAYIETWNDDGHAFKVYAIDCAPKPVAPTPEESVLASARESVRQLLNNLESEDPTQRLGFCIVHMGQEAVWLLLDWWVPGGIVCQRMLSAPLAQPNLFTTTDAPALACVWELVVIAHERDAWVRHMMTASPDCQAYLQDRLPAGRY